MKNLLLILITLGAGVVSGFFIGQNSSQPYQLVYAQKFEITDRSPESVRVRGSYADSVGLNMFVLECNMVNDYCIESPSFITKDGVAGVVETKAYAIIEKSPTRIVAEYHGLATTHRFIIDLALKEVTFTEEDIETGQVQNHKVVDGESVIRENI